MAAIDPFAPQEKKFRRAFLMSSILLALLLAGVLIPNSAIDLTISATAKAACPVSSTTRAWCSTWGVQTAQHFFRAIFVVILIATIVVTIGTLIAKRRWFGPEQARCWFMIAVLIVGPGLVANLAFKDNFGRARPRHLIEFGGSKVFTPPLILSSECQRNCSFISGEASAMYVPFFGLAFLLPAYRRRLLAIGIAAGSLAGAIRIIQGAHFLSDVLFAGVFMAITVSLLHIAFLGLRDPRRIWAALLAPLALAPRISAIEKARG